VWGAVSVGDVCGVASPLDCRLTVYHDVRTGPFSPQRTGRRTSNARRRGRDSESEDWSDDSMLDASEASFDLDDSDTDWRTRKTRDNSGSAALLDFFKVNFIRAEHSKYTRPLTFENLQQGLTRHGASGAEVRLRAEPVCCALPCRVCRAVRG